MADDNAKKTFKDGLGEKAEKVLGGLTILNTLHDIYDSFSKAHGKLPEEHKRILRLWFGWTRKDEELFNQDLSKLGIEEQVIWGKFLARCEDFQRSQIILLVAGMNADPGKQKITETTTEGGKKTIITTDAMPPVNERLKFLKSFAKLLSEKYKDNLNLAVEHALDRKLIMENPAHQKILDAWSVGSKWFKDNGKAIMKKIEEIKGKIPLKEEIYRGFFKEMFSVKRK